MADVRKIAFDVISRVLYEDAYSAIALNNAVREYSLMPLDTSFLSALVYGVLERKLTLEYIIRQYSSLRIKKIEKQTLIILYLGVYQLIFMDKVPDSAAVNESVKLCKKLRLYKSAGFVNAVLRNLVRAEKQYQLPDEANRAEYLSVCYSCPKELVEEWIAQYGETVTETILQGFLGRPPITVRVNTLKTTKEKLTAALEKKGIIVENNSLFENTLHLSHTGSLEAIPEFCEGHFFVEDAASQLCAEMLGAEAGETVCDVCAAPGGKSFYSAIRMENRGQIFAYDIHPHKLRLIEEGARRLGIDIITAAQRDAADYNSLLQKCDRLLCDVPCSGLGILRRKPEIRYKKDINIDLLPKLQYSILCISAASLPRDGILVYSTCTLRASENTDIVTRFLKEHPAYQPEPLSLPDGFVRQLTEPDHCLTILPGVYNTDGFFIAKLRRVRSDD